MRKTITFIIFFLIISDSVLSVERPFSLDLEAGPVWNTYNKIAIPNDGTATKFSLTEAVDIESKIAFRIKLGYRMAERHSISLLYAPLSLKGSGTLRSNIDFNEDLFLAGSDIDAVYKFNSYRLTYAYTWINKPKLKFKVGVTAKIRDAKISISDSVTNSVKENIGFVPLLHFDLLWIITDRLSFKTDLDAMIAPQGRAEDLFMGFLLRASPFLSFKLGYRVVEGGADVTSVYNFACLQYLTTGLIIEL